MNDIFEWSDFGLLMQSDWERIASAVSTKNIEGIARPFGVWLSKWESGKWIDHEKIYWTVHDLDNAGFWQLISRQAFIELYCKGACQEVIATVLAAA